MLSASSDCRFIEEKVENLFKQMQEFRVTELRNSYDNFGDIYHKLGKHSGWANMKYHSINLSYECPLEVEKYVTMEYH